MNSVQARSLIRETMTQPFDKGRFCEFSRNLLNHIDESKAKLWNNTYVKDAFKTRVNRFERVATYTDPNGEKVDLLIVHLERESSLERARTSLRNFVADYLNQRGQKEAALVAFVSPDEADWRFSFVKMEYATATDDKGTVRVSEKLSPARRYSFLVGANEHSHTAQKQFLPLLEKDEADPPLAEIESAFDIEKVTKEFFQRYKDLFERVRDELDRIVAKNRMIQADFKNKGIQTDDFAKKLLGQIVFLYFLQKKGWFGVERGAEWGTGNKQFLRYLFKFRAKFQARQERPSERPVNFFNDILEPLFYNTLATERANDYADRFDCRIPFLNGGLFEPLFDYDWVNTEILLPDNLFSNSETSNDGDTGTGVLDVFDRFNFTVNEAEPLEKEVAVDPEMLGKVFENLLPENLRYKVATYYTPRVVVNYMCQQSLINYLGTHLPDIARADIETFLHIGYAQAEFEAAGTKRYEDRFLPEPISANARRIDKLLEEITVCDPAIGSGAFPVGMMQEIVRARQALALVREMPDKSPYELKRHTIQNCLYGVDIDPGAIEIAKLRLWLSLVVDEDDRSQIQALPNLDYRIMQGNSLLDEFAGVKLLDEDLLARVFMDFEAQINLINQQINSREREATRVGSKEGRRSATVLRLEKEIVDLRKQRDALYRQADTPTEQGSFQDLHSEARGKLNELKQLHRAFFDEASPVRKKTLREQIERVEWEFMEATLKERGEDKALRELALHRRDNRKNYFLWKLHFVEVFERQGGFDVMIANPPYGADIDDQVDELRSLYSDVIQNYAEIYKMFFKRGLMLLREGGIQSLITPNTFLSQPRYKDLRKFLLRFELVKIINLGEEVFEQVVVPVCLSFIKRSNPTDSYEFADLTDKNKFRGDFGSIKFRQALIERAKSAADLSLYVGGDLGENQVTFDEALVIKDAGIQYHRSGIGLKNKGGNDLYERLFTDNRKQFRKSRPVWYGKLISRYFISEETDEFFNLDYKSVLKQNESASFTREAFNTCPKILWRQTASRLTATIDTDDRWFRNTIQCAYIKPEYKAKLDIRYLLGVINSEYIAHLYNVLVKEAGRVFPQVKLTHVKKLPLVVATKEEQTRIATLVDQILAAKRKNPQSDTTKLEGEIDALVYKLYKLTDDEIELVQGQGQMQLKR